MRLGAKALQLTNKSTFVTTVTYELGPSFPKLDGNQPYDLRNFEALNNITSRAM